MPPALLAAAAGLGLGMSLIVAIGAQNAFVLRQGLRLEHVAAVVAVCTVSDVVLIAAGVSGAGALLTRLPWLVPVVCLAG
ncbi:MAG: Lysine exporter protein, partial [Modestobacter sp.]|nr:Lysine exporter protein [Modestobacter sp.]